MEDKIAKTILARLYANRIIGAKHTAFENLQKGFPKHLRGEAQKVAKELIKKGFVTLKPTSYGLQVSLNLYKMAEIEENNKRPVILAHLTLKFYYLGMRHAFYV
ncbi:MAG: hypothetical protein QW270_02840 [Candidatus Bathyarchaeia archaeon]